MEVYIPMKNRCIALLITILLLALGLAAANAETLTLPADTVEIEDAAFLNCTQFTGALVLPEGVETVGASAFAGCTGFTGLPVIPATVKAIGAHAFDGCSGLSGTLYVANTVELDATAFDNCPLLTVLRGNPLHVGLLADGPVADGGFNAACYEGAKAFCDDTGYPLTVIEDAEDPLSDALAAGCNVLILPGYMFEEVLETGAAANPDVKFIGLDFTLDEIPANAVTFTYKEEEAGFMAGYAAVRLGYRKLGFLGGMEFPAVKRYGYGFLQGANTAASELNAGYDVTVTYGYANAFAPSAELTARIKTWYNAGVEVIFACGGGIWGSVGGAIMETGKGKLIGVDDDQAAMIDGVFGAGTTVTSAMKNLRYTVLQTLYTIDGGDWDSLAGTAMNLGVVSEDTAQNYVGLPDSTQFGGEFTKLDYAALVQNIRYGIYRIDDSVSAMPATAITVNVEE